MLKSKSWFLNIYERIAITTVYDYQGYYSFFSCKSYRSSTCGAKGVTTSLISGHAAAAPTPKEYFLLTGTYYGTAIQLGGIAPRILLRKSLSFDFFSLQYN